MDDEGTRSIDRAVRDQCTDGLVSGVGRCVPIKGVGGTGTEVGDADASVARIEVATCAVLRVLSDGTSDDGELEMT